MDRTYSIPDEVLELILLRLASPLHLIRAASTSKRLRRIVRDTGFLHRFATLNTPHLVVGSYYDSSIIPALNRPRPVFIPSPSASIDGSRFTLDFLWSDDICSSDPSRWTISDSRGSLLLLSFNGHVDENYTTWHLRAVVCEPVTRRYTVVAPLVRSQRWDIVTGPFFLDAGDDVGSSISLSSFRLSCVIRDRYYHPCHHHAVTFTSSASDCGHGSWRESNIELKTSMFFIGHTKASLYWHVENCTVAVMDRRTAEFTLSRLPGTDQDYWNGRTVVAGRDDEARIVIKGGSGVLKVFAKSQYNSEWALEKRIQLSNVLPGCNSSNFSDERAWIMVRARDTTLIVIELFGERWPYRLDIETMEAEQVSRDAIYNVAFPCELPWPPVFHALH